MAADSWILDSCVARLQELEPVRRVELRPGPADGTLLLTTPLGRLHYIYEVKRGLNRARLEHAILHFKRAAQARGTRPLLLTDVFPASLADVAMAAGIDFVDTAGNMTLNWPGKLYTNVRGKSAVRPAEAAARELMTPTGLQVIFALLADRHNTAVLTYRELADASGTSLAAVARVHAELRRRGFVEVQKDGGRVVRRKTELLGLWVGGYAERLRPKLVLGRYRSAEPKLADAFDTFITQARSKKVMWTVTGGFAADKLTGHYQGDKLTLFVDGWKPDMAGALRWLPSADGPITVLRPFSTHASHQAILKGNRLVADPLLVYAELLFEGRERERETARLVYEQYLAHLADAS